MQPKKAESVDVFIDVYGLIIVAASIVIVCAVLGSVFGN